jgi:hypothetical protein
MGKDLKGTKYGQLEELLRCFPGVTEEYDETPQS